MNFSEAPVFPSGEAAVSPTHLPVNATPPIVCFFSVYVILSTGLNPGIPIVSPAVIFAAGFQYVVLGAAVGGAVGNAVAVGVGCVGSRVGPGVFVGFGVSIGLIVGFEVGIGPSVVAGYVFPLTI